MGGAPAPTQTQPHEHATVVLDLTSTHGQGHGTILTLQQAIRDEPTKQRRMGTWLESGTRTR
jgi:hypothetical protein